MFYLEAIHCSINKSLYCNPSNNLNSKILISKMKITINSFREVTKFGTRDDIIASLYKFIYISLFTDGL